MDRAAKRDVLRQIARGFDTHDLDLIMRHFADDATYEAPRGADRWGRRFVGAAAIREAFQGRFEGIPNVRYRDDDHFVDGDRGASEWTVSGTSVDGVHVDARGCDLWTFRGGLIVRKDSYWKLREAPPSR